MALNYSQLLNITILNYRDYPKSNIHAHNMKNLILLLALLIVLPTTGQTADRASEGEKRAYVSPEKLAGQQIRQLKNGVLLVRLQSKEKAISALRANGHEEQAKILESRTRARNKEVAEAFRDHFTFCPVLFFYSDQTDELKAGNYNEVQFLNTSLQPDTSLHLNGRPYLIGDMGTMRRQEFKRTHRTSGQQVTFADVSNVEFPALVMLNDKFEQQIAPFPRYVKTYTALDTEAYRAVKRMNRRLHNCYKKYGSKR